MPYSIKVFTFNVPKKGNKYIVLYFKMLITYVQNF